MAVPGTSLQTDRARLHPTRVSLRRSVLGILLLTGGYLLLSLLFTWPLPLYLNSAVLGGRVATEDHGLYVWQLWWVGYALRNGMSPFVNPLVYYPDPVQFYVQPLSIVTSLLVAPALWLAGPYAAYNTAVLASFVFGGLCTYALLRFLQVRPWLAFVGGILFAFAPFHVTKYADGHLDLVQTQWVPLYLLALLRVFDQCSLRRVVAVVLAAALLVLSCLYWMLFSVLFSACILLVLLASTRDRQVALRLLLTPLAIAGGVALLLLPYWIGAFASLSEGGRPGLALSIQLYSADLLDFFTPNQLHPLWGQAALAWGARWHPYSTGGNIGLGYALVVAAVAATVLVIRGRYAAVPPLQSPHPWLRLGFWLSLLACMLVLCLGPELKVAGVATGLPMPYALIQDLPGVSVARKPNHAVLHAALCLVVIATLLAERLLHASGLWPRAAVLLGLSFALFEILPPRWQIFPALPSLPFFSELAANPTGEALLNLPKDTHTSRYLRQQMQHQRPITSASISRKPEDWFSRFVPGARQLTRAALDPPDVLDPPADKIAATSLDAYRMRFVLLHNHPELLPEQRVAIEGMLRDWLGPNALVYQDEWLTAYAVPHQSNPQPFAYLREGWYGVESQDGRRWRWTEGRAEVMVVNPHPNDLPVTLTIEGESPADDRLLRLALDGRSLAELLVPRARRSYTLHLLLRPGQSLLTLDSPVTLSREPDPRPLGVAITRIVIR